MWQVTYMDGRVHRTATRSMTARRARLGWVKVVADGDVMAVWSLDSAWGPSDMMIHVLDIDFCDSCNTRGHCTFDRRGKSCMSKWGHCFWYWYNYSAMVKAARLERS